MKNCVGGQCSVLTLTHVVWDELYTEEKRPKSLLRYTVHTHIHTRVWRLCLPTKYTRQLLVRLPSEMKQKQNKKIEPPNDININLVWRRQSRRCAGSETLLYSRSLSVCARTIVALMLVQTSERGTKRTYERIQQINDDRRILIICQVNFYSSC